MQFCLLVWVWYFSHTHVGEKFLIRWFRGYLISVTVGGRVGGRVSLSSSQSGSSDAMTLTIYDITNQFIGESVSKMICVFACGDGRRGQDEERIFLYFGGSLNEWHLALSFPSLHYYSPTCTHSQNFATCSQWQKFIHEFFSSVKDCTVDMVTFYRIDESLN